MPFLLLSRPDLARDARPVDTGLVGDPAALLRRQPTPDVEQGERGPDGTDATRGSFAEAGHPPIVPGPRGRRGPYSFVIDRLDSRRGSYGVRAGGFHAR
jgi:hypothetical protein